jgi:NAD(P)-dependent dehydrogenase (short-subunit alcohol dehydrogenase family)
MTNKLNGKTFIVTGANCGIGYGTALELAKRGARVILACRDEIKARQACDKIIETSRNDQVEVELLDLSSLKSIKAFSERIKAKLDRLDVLINNAGINLTFFYIKYIFNIIFHRFSNGKTYKNRGWV